MVAPDVQIEDGKGTILISSEEGETEGEPFKVKWGPTQQGDGSNVLRVASVHLS